MVLSSERWQRLESLFYEAIALSPREREAFLVERCAGDEAMRREAESLLASLDHPLDLLEKPIRNAASEVVTGGMHPLGKPALSSAATRSFGRSVPAGWDASVWHAIRSCAARWH